MCGGCSFFSRRGTLRLPRAYMMHCREAVSLAFAPLRSDEIGGLQKTAYSCPSGIITEPLPRAYIMHKDPHGSSPGSSKLDQSA
jgi:hypothetical protein